ncbi:MAG: hypothetical protein KDA33_04030 [Phycisphaerales bacterium]|nr:hypothetical protein [Phycisphaerales bacterium]
MSPSNPPAEFPPQLPAGHCPECDHLLMGAGRCPECGAFVSQPYIEADSRSVRKRRDAKVAFRLMSVGVLLIGGYWIFASGVWKRWTPTSWLIELAPKEQWAIDEVARRAKAGSLSLQECDAFAIACWAYRMEAFSPRPRDIPMDFRIVTDRPIRESIDSFVQVDMTIDAVRLDGRFVGSDRSSQNRLYPIHIGNSRRVILDDTLAPGVHRLEVDITIRQDLSGGARPGMLAVHRTTLSKVIHVIEDDIDAFVTGRFDEDLASAIQANFRLAICDVDGRSTSVLGGNANIPVAVAIEPSSSASDPSMAPRRGNYFPRRGRLLVFTAVDSSRSDADGPLYDIRLVPDPIEAFEHGDTEYFAGVIEWKAIRPQEPGSDDDPYSLTACENCEAPYGVAHTTITQWRPKEQTPDDESKSRE